MPPIDRSLSDCRYVTSGHVSGRKHPHNMQPYMHELQNDVRLGTFDEVARESVTARGWVSTQAISRYYCLNVPRPLPFNKVCKTAPDRSNLLPKVVKRGIYCAFFQGVLEAWPMSSIGKARDSLHLDAMDTGLIRQFLLHFVLLRE